MTRRTPLTAAEKETIIRFDETDAPASVFTYNKAWQRHIEGKLSIKPTFKNTKGGRDYEVPKKAIRLPNIFKRKVTPELRARRQAQARAMTAAHNIKRMTQRTTESDLAATAASQKGVSP